MFLNFLFNKHQQKTDEKQPAGKPDGVHAHHGDKTASQTGAQSKKEDDAEVVHGFINGLWIVGQPVGTQRFHAASQIANAHGAGKGIAVDFTKCLYLHGAGEGNHGIRQEIPLIRQKTYQKQKKDLNDQDQLTPMDFSGFLIFLTNQFRSRNTEGKKQEGDEIVNHGTEIPVTDVLA